MRIAGTTLGVRTTNPNRGASLHVAGASTGPNISAATPTNYSMIVGNSDTGYGTLFATHGSGIGEIQQRRTNSATTYHPQLQPHGSNVGIGLGSTSPSGRLNVNGDIRIGIYGTTASGSLYLTGTTANKQARLHCTNGNLHMDVNAGNGMYLNYYNGVGVYFGTGASGSCSKNRHGWPILFRQRHSGIAFSVFPKRHQHRLYRATHRMRSAYQSRVVTYGRFHNDGPIFEGAIQSGETPTTQNGGTISTK